MVDNSIDLLNNRRPYYKRPIFKKKQQEYADLVFLGALLILDVDVFFFGWNEHLLMILIILNLQVFTKI